MVDGFDNHDPTRALAIGSTWLRSRERVGHGPSTRRWRRSVGSVMIGSVPAATRDSVDYPV